MGLSGCAVLGCIPSKIHGRHRFVNPNKNFELFATWVNVTGNSKLKGRDPLYIYKHYRICSKHFLAENFEQRGTKRGIKENAVPSLHLPVSSYNAATAGKFVIKIPFYHLK